MQPHRVLWIIGLSLLAAACVLIASPRSTSSLNDRGDALLRDGDHAGALALYDRAAERGSQRGINNAAVIRFATQRWNPNLSKAHRATALEDARAAFGQLSRNGFAPGSYNYGLLQMHCRRDTPGYELAKERFQLAIEQGDKTARLPLALHMTRFREHPDSRTRQTLLTELAREGYASAASALANDVRGGRNPDPEAAEHWYTVAAEMGHVDAQLALGMWFQRDDAILWLTKAADQGSVVGMSRLGERYDRLAEAAIRCPVNRATSETATCKEVLQAKARDWRIRAVETNDQNLSDKRSGEGRHNRAINRIVIRPDGLRYRGFSQSSIGNINNAESAAYELALTYLHGNGVEPDREQALYWAKRAGHLPKSTALVSRLNAALNGEPKAGSADEMIKQTKKRMKTRLQDLHAPLLPLIENGSIQILTAADIAIWESSNDINIDRDEVAKARNRVRGGVYLVTRTIQLPKDMFGAHSAEFALGGPNVTIMSSERSHNRYYRIYKTSRVREPER
ncbi:MAG: hypothetical protein AAF996_09505 [Pseudomonadota bacterium]